MKFSKLVLFSILFLALVNCTRKVDDDKSKIQLLIPKNLTNSGKAVDAGLSQKAGDVSVTSGSNFNALLNPSVISGFNCFVVFVGGPGFDAGTCTTTDSMSMHFGKFVGGVPSGSSISLEVPSGSSRSIVVVGLYTQNAALCTDFHQNGPGSDFSEPFIIGGVTTDLKPGDVTVSVPVSLTAATKKISDCNMPGGGGGGAGGFFGMGEDGDFTWSATTYNLDTVSRVSDGRKLYSMGQVTALNANGSLYDVVVPGNWVGGNQIGNGDELMLYIAAAHGGGGECGSAFSGFSSSTRVMNATYNAGNTYMTVAGMDGRFATIPPSNLTATGVNSTPGTDNRVFCRLVAMRVPHLNNVTISGGAIVSTTSGLGTLGGTSHMGGVLPIRIAGILTVASGTNMIHQSGKGFEAGGYMSPYFFTAQSAFGSMKYSSSPLCVADANGGGELSGGGHGGAGGNTYAGQPIGDQYGCGSYDASMKCLTGKFFLGGGGGGNGGGTGGVGGGAIRLHAKSIVINGGTLYVKADGGTATYAGGAGGSVFTTYESLSGSSGSLIFSAVGGAGGGAGGGGGGRIHVHQFGVNSFAGTISATAAFGGGTPAGAPGTCLADNVTISGCP